jgi:hypothetical protein
MQSQVSPVYRSYSDKQFVEQHLAVLHTIVWLGQKSVQALLVKEDTQQIAALYEVELIENIQNLSLSAIRSVLGGFPVDILKTEHLTILLSQPKYTLVPEPLFVPEKAADLFSIVHNQEKFSTINHARIPQGVLLYATPDIFINTLRVAFSGADIVHAMQCVLPAVAKNNTTHPKLEVLLHDNVMEVICFEKNQLRYSNRFPFEADTDIIYFLLSAAEVLKLNNDKLEVCLYGKVSATSTLIPLMRKYIANVHLVQRPDAFQYPAAFREMQDQLYFPILTSLLCE